MPYEVADWVSEALNASGKSVKGARILVVGVAYKEDVGDTRESPALKVIELLAKVGADVHYHDHMVPSVRIDGVDYVSEELDRAKVEAFDCVVILTAHTDLNRDLFRGLDVPVVDTRNAIGQASA